MYSIFNFFQQPRLPKAFDSRAAMPSYMGNNYNATSHTQLLCYHHYPGVQLGNPTRPTEKVKYRARIRLGLYHVQHGAPDPTSSEQLGGKLRGFHTPNCFTDSSCGTAAQLISAALAVLSGEEFGCLLLSFLWFLSQLDYN